MTKSMKMTFRWTAIGWPHKIEHQMEQTYIQLEEDEERFRKLQTSDQANFNDRLDTLQVKKNVQVIWASSQQNLSSGFPTKLETNQSPQLQRLARILKFEASLDIILSSKRITKALISLSGCAGWSAYLLLAKTPKTGLVKMRPIFELVSSIRFKLACV